MDINENLGILYDRLVLFLRNTNVEYYRRLHGTNYFSDGIDVLAADWDNLLLMDACRYDMFVERVDLPGSLERRRSRGSMTGQFLEANFSGEDLTDCVYVTANPMLRRIEDNHHFQFHAVIDVWRDDGWDKEQATVLPETMVEYACKASRKYPNKRLIIHFMQPHFPFINSDTIFDKQIPDPNADDGRQFWNKLRTGELDISPETIWIPYNRNLDILTPALETLLSQFDGKTVVTSDHGNMVGERSYPIPVSDWGHPRGLYTPELIDIPWLVYESGSRKRIVPGNSDESNTIDHKQVRERLRDLGYDE